MTVKHIRPNYRNILLIRTDRIGDVVLTAPAVTVLKQFYPKARIGFLTREYTAPLLRHYKGIEHILIYQPEGKHAGLSGHLRLAEELRAHNFDAAVLFFPQPGLSFALWKAGIALRVGSGFRWSSVFLNHRVFEHRKKGEKHELEYNLSLLRGMVPRLPAPEEILFDFQFDKHLQKLQQQALQELKVFSPYAIIHPGSGGSAPRLPVEQFARITQFLHGHSTLRILVVGNGTEKPLVEQLLENLSHKERVHPVVGKWDLETYMAVIAGAQLFISNSTGPLHIARAYQVPVIAFYCPAVPCSPRRWGPYNQPETVLTPPVTPCKTCNPHTCPHGNCLAHIPWQAIQKKLEEALVRVEERRMGN